MISTFFGDLFSHSWGIGSLLGNHTFIALATVMLPFYGGAITAVAIGLVGRHLLGVDFVKCVILTAFALVLFHLAHLATHGVLTPY